MKPTKLMSTVQEVLSMTTLEVVTAATKFLGSEYKNVYIHSDNFVYAVGDSPICIVAHMDTVRDPQLQVGEKPRHEFHAGKVYNLVQNRNVLRNSTGVLGGDDRAGVFACIDLVRRCRKEKLPMPSVILTNGEESGGKGVRVFVATEVFKKYDNRNTRLFVEMDRQGCNDWVTYGTKLPTEVINYVESFGFRSSHGSYSDIADLQEEYLIPAVNLSIGYYQQHSANEYMHIDEMYMTIGRVMGMLKAPIDKLYPATAKVKYVNNYKPYEYKGTDNGKKNNLPTTTTTTQSSDTLWIDSVGRSTIDLALKFVTQGGFCMSCGYQWSDCDDTCGEIMNGLMELLTDEDLKYLRDVYLDADDEIHKQIEVYFKLIGETKTTDTKDPFHVGKEGDPVTVTEETKSTKEDDK